MFCSMFFTVPTDFGNDWIFNHQRFPPSSSGEQSCARKPPRLHDFDDYGFHFGIVYVLEVPRKKVIDTLRSGYADMKCIFFTAFWNSALCQKQLS